MINKKVSLGVASCVLLLSAVIFCAIMYVFERNEASSTASTLDGSSKSVIDSADTPTAKPDSVKRQEVSDNKAGQNQSDIMSGSSLALSGYSDNVYQALSLDSQQVVTGYLWHSYKGSPNFLSVTLPSWGTYASKDDTKTEYNIDIWDGKRFVFYLKTTPGKEVVFPQGGVYQFRVTGIDPGFHICSSDRGYFWGMKFVSTGTFNGTRISLTDKANFEQMCSSNGVH